MAQAVARIVEMPDVLGGKPRIDGTRIGVYFIHERIVGRGVDPKTLAVEHDLDVADVYRALTYYYDYPERMAAIQSRREQRLEAAETNPRAATGPDDLASRV